MRKPLQSLVLVCDNPKSFFSFNGHTHYSVFLQMLSESSRTRAAQQATNRHNYIKSCSLGDLTDSRDCTNCTITVGRHRKTLVTLPSCAQSLRSSLGKHMLSTSCDVCHGSQCDQRHSSECATSSLLLRSVCAWKPLVNPISIILYIVIKLYTYSPINLLVLCVKSERDWSLNKPPCC